MTYCEGIAQIHFNAWSYLDANLWASLVVRIFEGLNEYIGNDTKAITAKKEILNEFNNKLRIIKEERQFYEQEKVFNSDKLKSLELSRTKLNEILEDKVDQIRNASLNDIIKKVDETFKAKEKIEKAITDNASIGSSTEQLKEIIPEEYWNNPELAIEKLNGIRTFLREFFRKEKIGWNIFWLIIVLLIIFSVPFIIKTLSDSIAKISIVVPQIFLSGLTVMVPLWIRYKKTYDKLKPIISSFWQVKTEYEKETKQAMFAHEQLMQSTKIEIENKKAELGLLDKQINEVDDKIKNIEYKLENTLATETLHSFIEKRENSDIYKKHLGIVSTIREDFKMISELFVESNEEAKHEKFRENFEHPLERIVLYIDDLDRCSEDKVIEVLEAVNLIMAFPLFVVVVGVDPRWVKNALLKKYHLQFGDSENSCSQYKKIEASDYLEKIFQVPFHLKQANNEGIKYMLKQLSNVKEETAPEPPEDNLSDAEDSGTREGDFSDDFSFAGDTKTRNVEIVEEHLAINQQELELMQDLSGIIGNNPRAVKRFVNVYHIVRAHSGLSLRKNNNDKDYLIIMFLLALPIGPFKKTHPEFIDFVKTNEDSNILDSLLQKRPIKREYRDGIREKLILELFDEFLINNESFKIIRAFNVKELKEQNNFIQRFTFTDIQY